MRERVCVCMCEGVCVWRERGGSLVIQWVRTYIVHMTCVYLCENENNGLAYHFPGMPLERSAHYVLRVGAVSRA